MSKPKTLVAARVPAPVARQLQRQAAQNETTVSAEAREAIALWSALSRHATAFGLDAKELALDFLHDLTAKLPPAGLPKVKSAPAAALAVRTVAKAVAEDPIAVAKRESESGFEIGADGLNDRDRAAAAKIKNPDARATFVAHRKSNHAYVAKRRAERKGQ